MAKSVRTRTQAKKEKSQLKKLRELGIIKKFDARKAPTKAQKNALQKFSDLLTGKAALVKPKDAKGYKSIFRVVGDKVIVPKGKGEKITVNKNGNIVRERKSGGRTIKGTFKRVENPDDVKKPPKGAGIVYAVPFIRGRDASGKAILEWKRWPNYETLKAYMTESDSLKGYRDWADFVVEEKIGGESDAALRAKLENKLQKKARKWQKNARSKGSQIMSRSTAKQLSKNKAARERRAKRGR